jgi:hypothetical protein
MRSRLVKPLYFLFFTAYVLQAMRLTASAQTSQDLKTIVSKVIPLRADGKIEIPAHIKHIKLDIGLSYSAPMSQYWLTQEEDLWVFGFEPNPAAVSSILQGAIARHSGSPLNKKYIGKRFFLIPCALGLPTSSMVKFFVTSNDCGCSSIYLPKYFDIERVIEVPIFSLSDFFDLFPFDAHPVIDYIKIDTQGSDLNIVKSAGHYLNDRVIYVTLEAENDQYENTVNSSEDIENYMKSIGFVRDLSWNTEDPTYFNPRYSDYIQHHKIQIYQGCPR